MFFTFLPFVLLFHPFPGSRARLSFLLLALCLPLSSVSVPPSENRTHGIDKEAPRRPWAPSVCMCAPPCVCVFASAFCVSVRFFFDMGVCVCVCQQDG